MDFLNIDNAKSYATEEGLMKALAKVGLDKMKPLVVRNRAGRYTAGLRLSGMAETGNVTFAAYHGY